MKPKKRLDDLERKLKTKQPVKVVVDWDPNPGPPKPGEIVITWDDIEFGGVEEED
jgi:hypothetical protein